MECHRAAPPDDHEAFTRMTPPKDSPRFSAVVLAGDRTASDPVAEAAGVSCKAFARVGDQPMLLRVLDALRSSPAIDEILLCGPSSRALESDPAIAARLDSMGLHRIGLESTPTRSVLNALQHVSKEKPVLVTTADHALLTGDMIDHFCQQASGDGLDAVFGLARYEDIQAAYPQVRRTVLRFSDDGYCGCNLFALMTPEARAATAQWTRVENERKKPMRVIGAFGWTGVILYAIGRLSLGGALERLSKHLKIRVNAVIMPFAEAAIDVDTPADLRLVRQIVNGRGIDQD